MGRSQRKPDLQPVITRLQYPLAPLHPLPDGAPHPAFPVTLLHYHLLTEDQLNSIAQYYHQDVRSPCVWMHGYPTTMNWDRDYLIHVGETRGVHARVNIKKRKFGRFIGLRGCETPQEESEDYMQWRTRTSERSIKGAGDLAFWGRSGFRRW